MDAKSSYVGNIIYTILTSFIILLGKLRDLTCVTAKTSALRFDRTIPWCHDYGEGLYFLGCCDCGLGHFIISGHSFTPVRTRDYAYKLRFGAKAWTKPDPSESEFVFKKAEEAKVI